MTLTPPNPQDSSHEEPRSRTWRDIPPAPPLGSPLPPPTHSSGAGVYVPEVPHSSRKKLVGIVAGAALVLAAVAVLAAQGGNDSTDAEKATTTTSEESKSTSTVPGSTVAPGNTSPSVGAAGSPQAIAQAVGPAVVQIDDKGSIGSGVIYNKSGLILTAHHVVANSSTVTVVFADGTKVEGRVVGRQPARDLAVVAVTSEKELTAAQLADTANLAIGQPVVALGSPFGYQASVTSGIISGLNRQLKLTNLTLTGLIQTDAAINPGNSGGPLIDASNKVIGINTAIATTSGGSNGVGFAVPVNDAKELQEKVEAAGGAKAPTIEAPELRSSDIPGFDFQMPDSLNDLFGDLFKQFNDPGTDGGTGNNGGAPQQNTGFLEVNPMPSGWSQVGDSSFLNNTPTGEEGVHSITLIGPSGQVNVSGTKGSRSSQVAEQYKGNGIVRKIGKDITVVVEGFGEVSSKDLKTIADAVKEKK
ncbi:MAG: trypsin-like peptidase domain-containing protein [Ilumatobacteraceae bacterium]|nr:trypsin-like peptidase domain-containing protein [Ilumatobacteraceae bacterium]